jgi:hypothetical protein
MDLVLFTREQSCPYGAGWSSIFGTWLRDGRRGQKEQPNPLVKQ